MKFAMEFRRSGDEDSFTDEEWVEDIKDRMLCSAFSEIETLGAADDLDTAEEFSKITTCVSRALLAANAAKKDGIMLAKSYGREIHITDSEAESHAVCTSFQAWMIGMTLDEYLSGESPFETQRGHLMLAFATGMLVAAKTQELFDLVDRINCSDMFSLFESENVGIIQEGYPSLKERE